MELIFLDFLALAFVDFVTFGALASSGISGAEAHEIKKTENRLRVTILTIIIPRWNTPQTLVKYLKNLKNFRCL